jgi:ferric-dicitrate binding protein FerR (iron transport regulator)
MSNRRIGLWLAAVLILASVNAVGAGRQNTPQPLGFLATRGAVWIDKQAARPGTALFTGDVVTTGKDSVAVINLQSATLVTLSENGEVALSPDGGSSALNLRRGTLAVRNEGRQPGRIDVLDISVVVQAEGGFPAMCRIAHTGRAAAVLAQRGRVEIRGKGASFILAPGKSARLEAGRPPQGPAQLAGKVSNAIPEETVQPSRQTAEVPLELNDAVNWEDIVRTLRTGRVRIALLDRSFLNVGARSVMKITKHDAQSQQTEIELQLGRLRGEVVKITKPGGSFQVRTQTAVIGVVGTVFVIEAFRNLTRVLCVEGALTVQNINPAIVGQVTVHAGEFTTVPGASPPTGVVRATAARMQRGLAQTNAGEIPAPQLPSVPPTAPAQAAGAGAQAGATATSAVTAAEGAVSAGLSAGAVSAVTDATELAGQTNASLGQAAAANQSAADAAATAAEASADVNAGIQTVIEQLSPSGPGCGCLP